MVDRKPHEADFSSCLVALVCPLVEIRVVEKSSLTMQGGVETIRPYVDKFIRYAKAHPEQTFLVTPIGCGIAGFMPEDIAPLFEEAIDVENIHLPQSFWKVIV